MKDFKFKITFEGKTKNKDLSNVKSFKDFEELIFNEFKEELNKNDNYIYKVPEELNIGLNSFYDDNTYNQFYNSSKEIYIKNNEIFKKSPKIITQSKDINNNSKQSKDININSITTIIENNFNVEKTNLLKKITEKQLEAQEKDFKNSIDFMNINNEIHYNVICSNCFKINFTGIRFLCCECANFNLCQECEELKYNKYIRHDANHIFLRINNPIDIDIKKFDNLIEGNNQNLFINLKRCKKNYFTTVTILNNGENSFKDCYLRPICFGDNYIGGKRIPIDKDIKRTEEIEIIIRFEKIKKANQYFSKWRMFTEDGIPFGKVISFIIYAID